MPPKRRVAADVTEGPKAKKANLSVAEQKEKAREWASAQKAAKEQNITPKKRGAQATISTAESSTKRGKKVVDDPPTPVLSESEEEEEVVAKKPVKALTKSQSAAKVSSNRDTGSSKANKYNGARKPDEKGSYSSSSSPSPSPVA